MCTNMNRKIIGQASAMAVDWAMDGALGMTPHFRIMNMVRQLKKTDIIVECNFTLI